MDTNGAFESKIDKSQYKILIVDDVPSNVLLLKVLLTHEKYQLCMASNGDECISKARSEHPDLILLDVMMPGKSGFETAEIMKADPELMDIPIIFLTALNTPADLVKGFQSGGNDFLSKPFNKDELLTRVIHQIQLVDAKRTIKKQYTELQATMSNRDKMYSVIAHDLRSPMASIRMVLNLVVNLISPDIVGQEVFDLIDKANRESEQTHDLLDNLLKWTKSQTGRLSLAYQDFDIHDVVSGVHDVFQMIAETKGVKLNYVPAGKDIYVHADKDVLSTVIRNFTSNAVKFTPEGKSITISVDQPDEKFARVNVKDEGVGISEDRIAGLFHKGETTYGTNNEEGSGLGLQLCKDFAIKNGGDVQVTSVLGEGSTFSVLVPLV